MVESNGNLREFGRFKQLSSASTTAHATQERTTSCAPQHSTRRAVRRKQKPPSYLSALLPVVACLMMIFLWSILLLAFVLIQDQLGGDGSLYSMYRYPLKPLVECIFDAEDTPYLNRNRTNFVDDRITRYIVINEPRSGSSWLQEMSQMHPGIKVQFELDMQYGESALACKQCLRPWVPNSKYEGRIPRKEHPPRACGMTIFGSSNHVPEVASLAVRTNASLVILLRINHVAHAISAFLQFGSTRRGTGLGTRWEHRSKVPWRWDELERQVDKVSDAYERLLQYAWRAGRPTHVMFYEDLKRDPVGVWEGLQQFLGLPLTDVPGLTTLERKSTSRPSVHYLTNLDSLVRRSGEAAPPWAEMLSNPAFDDAVNVSAEFEALCKKAPADWGGSIAWRGSVCRAGVVEPLPPSAPQASPEPFKLATHRKRPRSKGHK